MALTPDLKQDPVPASIYYIPIDLRVGLGSRLPYLLVTPKYRPMATLTRNWDEFMASFFALFYCHAMLWSIGIRHGDISETNLMWDPEEEKPKLCDFDLSHFCEAPPIGVPEKGPDGPMGLSNTGTWIFMADELLTVRAMSGLEKRVYRHEVEAFVAVLLWITCRYKDGKVRPEHPLEDWNQATHTAVKDMRSATFQEIRKGQYTQPDGLPDRLWDLIKYTVSSMFVHRAKLELVRGEMEKLLNRRTRVAQTEMPDSLDDYDDLRAFRKVLAWEIFEYSSAELFNGLMCQRILNSGK